MDEIWVIVSKSGIVRRAYGWFETEGECVAKCEELRTLRVLSPSDYDYYTPVNLLKNAKLGKN